MKARPLQGFSFHRVAPEWRRRQVATGSKLVFPVLDEIFVRLHNNTQSLQGYLVHQKPRYRGISRIRKRPPPKDNHRALGIVLL